MVAVHLAVGIAVIAGNLIAGGWGGIAWLRHQPSVGFWYALRVAQAAVVLLLYPVLILCTNATLNS